jgi:hypothetical protein
MPDLRSFPPQASGMRFTIKQRFNRVVLKTDGHLLVTCKGRSRKAEVDSPKIPGTPSLFSSVQVQISAELSKLPQNYFNE